TFTQRRGSLFAAVCWGETLDPVLIELLGVVSCDVGHRQIANDRDERCHRELLDLLPLLPLLLAFAGKLGGPDLVAENVERIRHFDLRLLDATEYRSLDRH